MKPHASLKEGNLSEREIDVSSEFGFHFGRAWRAVDRSVGVNWTVLAEDMMRALVVKSRRRMAADPDSAVRPSARKSRRSQIVGFAPPKEMAKDPTSEISHTGPLGKNSTTLHAKFQNG
jgi:hypothetical protein